MTSIIDACERYFFFLENMKDSDVLCWVWAEAYLRALNLKTSTAKTIHVLVLKNPKRYMLGDTQW